MQAVVFQRESESDFLQGRSARSLAAAGLKKIERTSNDAGIGGALVGANEPVLLLRAGAWLVQRSEFEHLPSSETGRSLVAFGICRSTDNPEYSHWAKFLAASGGDAARRGWRLRKMLLPPCLYLEPAAARSFGELIGRGMDLDGAWAQALRSSAFRVVHTPRVDAHFDPRLRVVQLVTTIHIGGAERVTLDLAEELRAQGASACVAVFGKPSRLAFPEPPNFADLSDVQNDAAARAEAVAQLSLEFGADVIHAHLIRAREAQAIREGGFPLVMTIHNMSQSWPVGLESSGTEAADLLLACSNAVAGEVRERLPEIPVRTVWNGIDAAAVVSTPERAAAGVELRRRVGFGERDFVLVAVANPRRQKRLDRLPNILCEVQRRLGPDRRARLLLAGAPAGGSRDAEEAAAALQSAIESSECAESIQWTGPVLDTAPILAAGDIFISVSEFEGLSLAHLEALAAGLPVVATDVGGTREIAAKCPKMRLVEPEADDAAISGIVAELARAPGDRTSCLAKSFLRAQMARRCRFFYHRVIEPPGSKGAGLWLITNNLSTGGAQSSARRLLLGLAKRGVKVRAAVIQENPDAPTPGRKALLEAGIPVLAIPPYPILEAEEAVLRLARQISADPPEAVVFWNLIVSSKLLLTEALLETPVYDVSPGEMYFDSLQAYFEKPRTALPFTNPLQYGRRLSGFAVKYRAEASRVEDTLGIEARVIPNGIPMPKRPLRQRRAGLPLVFGTAARLAPQKRIEDLLSALQIALPRLPRCILRIAGGPEFGQEKYATNLRKLARGLPVEWCGEHRDTAEFLAGLDVFVMISEPAGCPNASLEALASGLPVIATDVGGASEQVIPNHTGLLVPRRDDAAFANAMVTLAADAKRREILGENARRHVDEHFSLESMISSYAEWFGLAAASRGSPIHRHRPHESHPSHSLPNTI